MKKNKIKDNQKYIILEIIPTALSPQKGPIAQISALKLQGLTLLDRFDYRLDESLIYNHDILNMISYDKNSFNYTSNEKIIKEKFKKWTEDLELLIIDNEYTFNYLEYLNNKKTSIFSYLGMEFNDNIIAKIIQKYNLQPSNHIVDILYEALIYESNNK